MRFIQQVLVFLRTLRYPGSRAYWEKRYANGGNSGSGSSGTLAAYKATMVNDFVKEQGIQSVLEFGCGDGQQLQLGRYPSYTGLDISPSAVAICQVLFAADPDKYFMLYVPEDFQAGDFSVDLTLSMEVIFHLTEESVYQAYMQHLFGCARRWVIIFADNSFDTTGGVFPHFKPRPFLQDIPAGWVLKESPPNPHEAISISKFFFFEKTMVE